MENITDFSDERHKTWCIHCGRSLSNVTYNRDHSPTESFLRKPYPSNLPVVLICLRCNKGFSKDEDYFVAFLSSVISGTTDPEQQVHPSAKGILRHTPKLRERIDKSRIERAAPSSGSPLIWKPEVERINNVVLKNARGHAYFEFGEPMRDDPVSQFALPLESMSAEQRSEFENPPAMSVWPELGSRMFTRVATGQDLDGGWIMLQDKVYRYAVFQNDSGGITVRAVVWDYLATEVVWE